MKKRKGVTIHWPSAERDEFIPSSRTTIVIWKDRFGTVNATGWGPDVDEHTKRLDRAISLVVTEMKLNKLIER